MIENANWAGHGTSTSVCLTIPPSFWPHVSGLGASMKSHQGRNFLSGKLFPMKFSPDEVFPQPEHELSGAREALTQCGSTSRRGPLAVDPQAASGARLVQLATKQTCGVPLSLLVFATPTDTVHAPHPPFSSHTAATGHFQNSSSIQLEHQVENSTWNCTGSGLEWSCKSRCQWPNQGPAPEKKHQECAWKRGMAAPHVPAFPIVACPHYQHTHSLDHQNA